MIDGSLRWSQWENTEGKKQSKVEIHVENFQFLDPKGSASYSESEQNQPSVAPGLVEPNKADSNIIDEDDIPF